MRNFLVITLVFTLVTGAISGVAASFIEPEVYEGKNFYWSLGSSLEKGAEQDFEISKNFDGQSILRISLNSINDDLEIIQADQNEISLTVSGKIAADQVYKMEDAVEVKGDHLLITPQRGIPSSMKNKDRFFGLRFEDSSDFKIQLIIPKHLEILSLKTVSSDLVVANLNVQKIQLKSVSGNIQAHNLKASNVKVATVSGDIKLAEVLGDNQQISSVSGDVFFDSTELKQYLIDFDSLSGSIVGYRPSKGDPNQTRELKVKTVSGDLHLKEQSRDTL